MIALAKSETDAVVQVFFIRAGKLIGREHFYMKGVEEKESTDILGDFVKQFYAGTPYIPREIMLQYEIEDTELLENWLSDRRGSRTYIRIPKIGSKEKLVELAAKNASLVLEQDRQQFLDGVSVENIVKNTENKPIYSVPFRRVFENGVRYYRVEFSKLDLPGGKTGIVTGFRNVDEEVNKEMQIQQSLRERSAVIEALTRSYDSVWFIKDMETQQFELFRVDDEMVHYLPTMEAVKIEKYYDAFLFYSKLVLQEDRQRFIEAVTPEKIIANTEGKPIYSVPFRRVFEDGIRYYRVEFARMDMGNGNINIVTGFKNVDDEFHKDR